ncbi:hypothetical protein MHUMG1_03759 [Metarhizium humberi]|uniref:Uncharacterized protein n=1 Tax=Metarhizium humberi TaxID=2596975 RepID=A0A9P8MDZ1_9HYPO|nr:hypothetical protein MHUMG1_03759 [Metarhizium humberi]
MDLPITHPVVELDENILRKLQSFLVWVRLGMFQEASRCFERWLRRHEHHLCVFMEYTEMLLMQESYSTFSTTVDKFQLEFLPQYRDTDRVDLEHLLRLMKTLAGTLLDGITQEKLSEALEFWDSMESTYSVNSRRGVNIIQVYAIEMYMRIITAAFRSNQLEVEDKYFGVPFQLPPTPCPCSGCWYKYLITNGLHKEALTFQSIVLSDLSAKAAMDGFMRNDLFATMVDEDEAEKMTLRRVVTELDTSNKICEYLLMKQPLLLSLAEAYIDVSIFFKGVLSRTVGPVAMNRGRPLLRLKELEELVNQRRSDRRSNSQ